MPINPLDIVSLVGTGVSAVTNAVRGARGSRLQRDLWNNRPQLSITEGERNNDALYNLMAGANQLPGQNAMESRMDQAVSEGIYEGQRTANSSLTANKNAIDLNAKRIDAIQNLGLAFADFKQKRLEDLTRWNSQKTQLEQQRWDINTFQPWNIKMNEAVDLKKQGWQGFGSAVNSGIGILNDMAGTQQYLEMLKKINPNLGK